MKMKFQFILLFALLPFITFAQKKKVHWSELDNHRGRIFQRNHQEPFTGTAYDEYTPGEPKGSIQFKDGIMHGRAIQWNREGKKASEVTFVNGKKEGKEIQWYPNGNKKVEVLYVNGQPNGTVVEYHENGKKLSQGDLMYGKENGVYTWWFDNGQKDQELRYNMGVVNGKVLNWYPDGQQKMIAYYKNGVKHGSTKNWYDNGALMSLQNYNRDIEVDTSKYWEKDGRLIKQEVFERGASAQVMDYNEASVLIREGYIHIFNKLGSNFTVDLRGETVTPVNSTSLAFLIDGKAIQLFATSIPTMYEEGKSESDDKLILKRNKEIEVGLLEAKFDTTFATTETFETIDNKTVLHWSFETPKKNPNDKITVIEEHYYGVVVQNHVLLLNGIIIKDGQQEDVKKILKDIIKSVKTYDKPIDVIAFAKNIKEKK